MLKTDLITIGEVVKAQGIKGELKVIPLTENQQRFSELKRIIWSEANGNLKEYQVAGYRPLNQFVLLKLVGIDDLTTAEALGRGYLYIPKSERPNLPPGRYYYDEIISLKVWTVLDDYLGVITDILETGSNDVYVVEKDSFEILIPALKSVIQEISLAEGKMVVSLPPGLVED